MLYLFVEKVTCYYMFLDYKSGEPKTEEDKAKAIIKKAKVEDDEYQKKIGEEQSYYGIAHTVHEIVTEQASIMINGKLKEYQVKGKIVFFLWIIYFFTAK